MNPWEKLTCLLPFLRIEFSVLRVNSESASCKGVSREVPWIKAGHSPCDLMSAEIPFICKYEKARHCGLYKHIPCFFFHESGCLEVVYCWHWEENEAICLFLFHEMKKHVLSRRNHMNKCTEMCKRMIPVAITFYHLLKIRGPFLPS